MEALPAREAGPPVRLGRQRAARRHPRLVILALVTLAVLAAGALGADFLRPWDDRHLDLRLALRPPSAAHPLGTDSLGRDVLAQVLHGLRVSLAVSAGAALLAALLGGAVGLVAGALGGRVDFAVMRAVDVFQSQNHFLLSILMVVLFRPVFGAAGAILLAVSLTHWVTVARIVRAQLLSLREQPFIAAAVNGGASPWRLVRVHYLPHLAPALMLAFVLLVPHAIFHESGLSFLGLGMPPQQASLGSLVAESRQALLAGGWWLAAFPGAVIFLAAGAVSILGEYWRVRLHPRWRSELELS